MLGDEDREPVIKEWNPKAARGLKLDPRNQLRGQPGTCAAGRTDTAYRRRMGGISTTAIVGVVVMDVVMLVHMFVRNVGPAMVPFA